jgi:hypothetical protein
MSDVTSEISQRKRIVSGSEIDAFNLCTRRHFYAFHERLERKNKSESLTRGIAGHELYKVFWTARSEGRTWERSLELMEEALSRMIKNIDMKVIINLYQTMTGSLNHYRNRCEEWEILSVEQVYKLEFPDFIYAYSPDLVVRENGATAIVDYKFTYNFYNDVAMQLLPQIPRYVGAHRALNMWVQKGYYWFNRYRIVKEDGPRHRYLLDPVILSNARIKNAFDDVIGTAKRIVSIERIDETIRNANNFVCNTCSFKNICVSELNGGDGKLVRQLEFQPSTYGYQEAEE